MNQTVRVRKATLVDDGSVCIETEEIVPEFYVTADEASKLAVGTEIEIRLRKVSRRRAK